MTIHVVPLRPAHVAELGRVLAARVRALRAWVPDVPPALAEPGAAGAAVGRLAADGTVLVALDGDDVVGHLGWYELPSLRRAPRRAAWAPEVGHSARDLDVLERLYLVAADRWADSRREVVSVTALVDDPFLDWWADNGFGRFLHDTVRPCSPLGQGPTGGVTVRAATTADADALAALDVAHCAHYGQPPTFMVPPDPTPPDGWVALLAVAPDAVWVADDGRDLVGFVRFEASTDGLAILQSADSVTVKGIYTRPDRRSRGLAAAMLSAGMGALRGRGIQRVAIDHETTNPPARHFWPHHTTTVAVSLMRILERP